jgi:signal transduction histidine kinase
VRAPLAIRTRLTLSYGAVLAATVFALGLIVWLSSGAMMRSSLGEALQVQAADVRAGMNRAENVAITRLDPARPGIFTALFGARGQLLLHSPGIPPGLKLPPSGTSTAGLSAGGTSYALLAEPAPDHQTIVVGSSLAEVDRNLGNLAMLLAGIGAAGSMASLAGGWLLSGRALDPVERLTNEANSIGANDLQRRLPQPARLDEVGRLSQTLNGMLDRVADSIRRERAFVSAASHDLRTPITALRTELELAELTPDDSAAMLAAIRVAHADAVRLSNLATDLLDIAEAEATGRALVRQPVSVDELMEGAITRLQPLAAERSTRVHLVASMAVVDVDRVRLEQALVNLLSNAIREGPGGSLVEVVAKVNRVPQIDDGSWVGDGTPDGMDRSPLRVHALEVAVLDRGPGVPEQVRPVLFVPFASRAGGRSDGVGLGLATAAAAVHAHFGAIGYEDRPGGGATFWFRVPVPELTEESPALRVGPSNRTVEWSPPARGDSGTLVVEGRGNAEIGDPLFISERTGGAPPFQHLP